nr:indian hedgehog protein-like [Dermacentor andersoni]
MGVRNIAPQRARSPGDPSRACACDDAAAQVDLRMRDPPGWVRCCALLLLLLPCAVRGCSPGPGGGRRRSPRKLTPLVFKQHVPNVPENMLAASGLPEGRVDRSHKRFRDLVPNYNADIVFKDEEGTGADRLMTQRCKSKLNTLAVSVMNQWPGVRLRVTEGWDEEGHHAPHSLHYEGRAVDVTTSDRERSKYGMLARLAVEAGFDWVYYESRTHIHLSVKSESYGSARTGGCFHGDGLVQTPVGAKRLADVLLGDRVLALGVDGRTAVFSEVIAFMDRQPEAERVFYSVVTECGRHLTLTPGHLVFYVGPDQHEPMLPTFAARIRPGGFVLAQGSGNYTGAGRRLYNDARTRDLRPVRVRDVRAVWLSGVYAPLTREGTVIVDGVAASCYAGVQNQALAHWAFAPLRLWRSLAAPSKPTPCDFDGVHWYADVLYRLFYRLLPRSYLLE